jgi:hypothetical protein
VITTLPRSVLFLAAALLLAPPAADAAGRPGLELSAVAGAGVDCETAESSPARLLAGLRVSDPVVDLRITADCGVPWEPSLRGDADFTILDARFLRAGFAVSAWVRAYGSAATETGALFNGRVEIGPRVAALSAAGGFSTRSTYVPAIAGTLRDSFPWARVGIASRPVEQARFELAVSSDGPLALWLRTSFELSAWWRLPSGVRLEGLLAARYSDLFTLTAYLDGFDARASVLVPLAARRPS